MNMMPKAGPQRGHVDHSIKNAALLFLDEYLKNVEIVIIRNAEKGDDLMNEIETVQKEVTPLSEQALIIRVQDQLTLTKANDFFLVIRQMRKKIGDVFDPIIEAAKEAKRKADLTRAEAVRQKEKIEEPLLRAEAYLNGQITDYKREQDKIRQEEEERNRQKAIKEEMERRKKEEDQRLKEAAKLEKAGAKEEAEALVQEIIEAQEEPIQIYVAPPATPKVELNGMATVTTWHAEVTNLKELCLAVGQGRCPTAYVEANLPALNSQAVHLKLEMRIPGVKAVSETKSRPTGRR